MFKKFFKRKINTDAFTNLVAEGSTVQGGMIFSGILKVQGTINSLSERVRGESVDDPARDEDCLIIDVSGKVQAPSIECADLVIAGTVNAPTIKCRGQIKILKTAVIHDCIISYNELEIELGAQVHNCTLVNMKLQSPGGSGIGITD